jgi:hypothetical protein
LAAAFVLAYLATQLLLPTLALAEPRLGRFGWQMFARVVPRTTYTLELRSGAEQDVDPSSYVAQPRAELELDRLLPPHLCRVVPEAAAVRIGYADGAAAEVACR